MTEQYTSEHILAMEPGRELDKLVAEKVMGLSVRMLNEVTNNSFKPQYDRLVIDVGNGRYTNIHYHSTDLSAAWEVVETLQASHMYTDIRTCADFFEVWVTIPPFIEEEHKTVTVASPKLPAAICKAALLAVMDL